MHVSLAPVYTRADNCGQGILDGKTLKSRREFELSTVLAHCEESGEIPNAGLIKFAKSRC